jgi:hypothetical protein
MAARQQHGVTMSTSSAYRRAAGVCAALGLASVFPYLSRMGYRIPDIELLLISAATCGGAALAGWAVARWTPALRALQFLLLYWIVDLYFSPLSWLAALAALLIIASLHTRFRPNVEAQMVIFPIGFSAVMAVSAFRPFLPDSLPTTPAARPDLPPIVHLILDEFMSPEAIATLPGGEALAKRITDDYVSRGFRVMLSTRSESAWSPESIGRTFNAEAPRPIFEEHKSEDHAARHYALQPNRYFARLAAIGYEIEVIESAYIGLCADTSARCRSYPFGEYGHGLARYGDQLAERVGIALRIVYAEAALKDAALEQVALLAWLGRDVLRMGAVTEVTRSASMPDLFDHVRAGVRHVPLHGRALVIHALFPHFPWVLDSNCRLLPAELRSAPAWKNQSLDRNNHGRTRDERSYLAQTECAHDQVMDIVDIVRRQSNYGDAVFIIHGDHGSRIADSNPMTRGSEISDPAPSRTFDTLFAIAGPELLAGVEPRRQLLPARFEESLTALLPEWAVK